MKTDFSGLDVPPDFFSCEKGIHTSATRPTVSPSSEPRVSTTFRTRTSTATTWDVDTIGTTPTPKRTTRTDSVIATE